jgi:ATP-binding cassette, subfamily B, bacterial
MVTLVCSIYFFAKIWLTLNQLKKQNMITLKTLFIKYSPYLITVLVLATLVNALNLYVPKLIGETIDNVIKKNNLNYQPVILILSIGVAYLIFALLELAVSTWFSEKFAMDTRIATMNNLVKQPYQYVINEGSAKVITILGSDIDNIQDNFTSSLTYIFQAIVLFIGAAVLMFMMSWKLTLIALVSIPIVAMVFGFIFGKVGKLFQLSQRNLTDLNNTVAENISSSLLVRVLSSYVWENAKFGNNSELSKKISFNIIRAFSVMLPATNFLTNITVVIILYFGFGFYGNKEISLGQLTTFIGYYSLLITPIFILGFTLQSVSQAFASWSRVAPLLNANEQRVEGDIVDRNFEPNFEIKNLNLEYGGKSVLKDVTFDIKAGQKTAILGPTGAGKSQLLNLLVNLNKPTSGQILLNGKNIDQYDMDILLKNVGICFQESLLFDNSLLYNITLGRDVTDAQLNTAIDTANLRKLVEEKGLDVMINERGANLSGGQKQRVTLARAIIMEPKLILLDDFTARVDSNTEKEIRDNMSKNYPTSTIVQIAQKIESIIDYDNIIVIMEGQIVGQGKHEDLIKTCIEYQQIYKSQQLI